MFIPRPLKPAWPTNRTAIFKQADLDTIDEDEDMDTFHQHPDRLRFAFVIEKVYLEKELYDA